MAAFGLAGRKTTNRLRAIETWPSRPRQTSFPRRKTTNRLRAIETEVGPPVVAQEGVVARQLIACGRLKLQSLGRVVVHERVVARQLIACGRLKLNNSTMSNSLKVAGRKTTNRLRAIETTVPVKFEPSFMQAVARQLIACGRLKRRGAM